MSGDPNHLEEAVRESLAKLSDKELIWRTMSREYTAFARQAAREEISRRSRVAASRSISAVNSSNKKLVRKGSPREVAGCYIDVWRDKSYEGEHLRVHGPGVYSNLRSHPTEWGNDVGSLRVGPRAFVEAYEHEGLSGNNVCFGPNQEVADLSEFEFDNKLGSIKIIDSIRILEGLGSDDSVETDVYEDLAGNAPKSQKGGKRKHNRKAQKR